MPNSPMVGRDREVAVLDAAVSAIERGERRLLVIRGEPGMGKSRLLDALQDLASRRGFTVLRGQATELESDDPLAPMLQALGPRITEYPFDSAAELSPASRWRLYGSITAGMDTLSEAGPLALAIDDVHWADPVTLELLEHIIRRPPRTAQLVVLTLRPGAVGDHLLDAQRMAGGGGVVIDLLPLDVAAAEQLMPESLPPIDRARIFRESGGNPMLIEELARAGGTEAIPGGIRAHVRVELGRTPQVALRFLQAGAVLGDPFDIDVAGAVADLSRVESVLAVDDLVDRWLLRATPNSRKFTFRHPIVRTAVYAGMPAGSRLATHGRAAEVLAEAGAPLVARARHLIHSAAPGDTGAAAQLRAAAVVVRPQAPVIAADWLVAAQTVDPTADLDVVCALAETLVDAGRLVEALTVADDGLATRRSVDGENPDGLLRLVLVAASVERLLGRHDAARRRLIRALPQTGSTGPSAARVMANLALSAYEGGAFDEFGAWAERARAAGEAEPLVKASVAALLSVGHTFAGHAADSRVESDLAIAAIDIATDQDLAAHAELLAAVPWGLIAVERLPEALATGRRAAAAAARAGNGSATVALELGVVLSLGLSGRIRDCVDGADRAEQSARATGVDQTVQWALWMRAWALLERGQVRTANVVAAESVALAAGLDDSSLVTVARAVRGAALVAAGEPARGRPLIAAYDLDPGWVCRWAPVLVEADLTLGDLPAGREHAGIATAFANHIGLAGPRAAAGRALAQVVLAEGDARAAHDLAMAAAGQAATGVADLEVARATLIAGRALGEFDRKAAIRQLEFVRQLADHCGAQRVHDEAVRELRRLGRRVGAGGPRASGVGELGVLSPREREIAELVAQGCTNKDIAGRLFLSEKTVESHLSRTFAKLDVRSRSALAARFSQATGHGP
jgi:DNA-binding NarL/FixJ family response regulator